MREAPKEKLFSERPLDYLLWKAAVWEGPGKSLGFGGFGEGKLNSGPVTRVLKPNP